MPIKLIIILLPFLILMACTSSQLPSTKTDFNQAADYNVQLGLAYLQAGDMPRAKQKLLLALSQAPEWPVALDAMAYYLECTGSNVESEAYYKKAIHHGNNSGMALNNYGAYLCRIKRYDEAEKYLLAAAKQIHYTNTADAYENAGICALEMPNRQKAFHYFLRAVEQDPQRARSLYMLADLSYLQSNYLQAQKYLRDYLKLEPVSAQSLWLKIRLSKKLAETVQASNAALQLRSAFPNSKEYRLYREQFNHE